MDKKLHDVIADVLQNSEIPLTVLDIAKIIKKNKLWKRPSDGAFPEPKQISDRVNHYKHLFDKTKGIVTLKTNFLEKRLLRITWNENLWEKPSGHEWEKSNQGNSSIAYENQFGFGGEEWLFNLRYNIDGFQYGYIRGLWEVTNIDFIDEAYLFSIDPDTKDRLLIAILRNVVLLDPFDLPKAIKSVFQSYKTESIDELKSVNADYKQFKLHDFYPVVKFRIEEASIFDQPLLINEIKVGQKYNRFKPYIVDGTLEELLRKAEISNPFIFTPGKRLIKKDGHERISNPRTSTIVGVHNKLCKHLEAYLAPEYSVLKKNLSIERTLFGGNIADVVLKESNGSYRIIEIKTSNNTRYNIREALGQLIDYAYWYHDCKIVELIIASPSVLSKSHQKYLERVKNAINIKVSYWEYVPNSDLIKSFNKY